MSDSRKKGGDMFDVDSLFETFEEGMEEWDKLPKPDPEALEHGICWLELPCPAHLDEPLEELMGLALQDPCEVHSLLIHGEKHFLLVQEVEGEFDGVSDVYTSYAYPIPPENQEAVEEWMRTR